MFAGGQLILALLIAWWLHTSGNGPIAVVVAVVSAVVFILGMLRPQAIAAVYAAWMLVTFPIGWVMSYVVAGVMYFLVITPIGLALRAKGRDGLEKRFDEEADTYWVDTSSDTVEPKQYFRQF